MNGFEIADAVMQKTCNAKKEIGKDRNIPALLSLCALQQVSISRGVRHTVENAVALAR